MIYHALVIYCTICWTYRTIRVEQILREDGLTKYGPFFVVMIASFISVSLAPIAEPIRLLFRKTKHV